MPLKRRIGGAASREERTFPTRLRGTPRQPHRIVTVCGGLLLRRFTVFYLLCRCFAPDAPPYTCSAAFCPLLPRFRFFTFFAE